MAIQVGRAVIDAVGGTGTSGVTTVDGSDAGLVPTPFSAVTVNVCGVPFARPVTVQARAPLVVQVLSPGELVAV